MNTKRFIALAFSVLLIIAAMLSTLGCAAAEIKAPTQIIEDVTAQEAFTLIQKNQSNPDFVIIDVRTPGEFAEGHVVNAINIDFLSESFRNEIDNLDKNKTYLIYCRSGQRSADALSIMKELNFTKIYHMSGGILEWTAEGLPETK